MNDRQYLQHCQTRLREFALLLCQQVEHLPEHDPLRELAVGFEELGAGGDELYTRGNELVVRLFTTHAEFAPLMPRELLWFFGGDCLHFMPDDEIARFQQLEDMRLDAAARGDTLDIDAARARLLASGQ